MPSRVRIATSMSAGNDHRVGIVDGQQGVPALQERLDVAVAERR